jgi:hypothetical protein
MLTIEFLKHKFGVSEDKDLAGILGRTPGAVSNWRNSGIPAAIERKAYKIMKERGIPTETEREEGRVTEPATPYPADPLRVAIEEELNKLSRAKLSKLLNQLVEENEGKSAD